MLIFLSYKLDGFFSGTVGGGDSFYILKAEVLNYPQDFPRTKTGEMKPTQEKGNRPGKVFFNPGENVDYSRVGAAGEHDNT